MDGGLDFLSCCHAFFFFIELIHSKITGMRIVLATNSRPSVLGSYSRKIGVYRLLITVAAKVTIRATLNDTATRRRSDRLFIHVTTLPMVCFTIFKREQHSPTNLNKNKRSILKRIQLTSNTKVIGNIMNAAKRHIMYQLFVASMTFNTNGRLTTSESFHFIKNLPTLKSLVFSFSCILIFVKSF